MKKHFLAVMMTFVISLTNTSPTQAQILTIKAGTGINSIVVHQGKGQTDISGSVDRRVASHRVLGSHIHVELLDLKGTIIACSIQALPPTAPRQDAARNYRTNYSVRLPSHAVAKASAARVHYVNHSHRLCPNCENTSRCPSC
jgi:hypothetical protein